MKKYLELLKNAFALNSVMAIFDNDAHSVVSKRGWKQINEEHFKNQKK